MGRNKEHYLGFTKLYPFAQYNGSFVFWEIVSQCPASVNIRLCILFSSDSKCLLSRFKGSSESGTSWTPPTLQLGGAYEIQKQPKGPEGIVNLKHTYMI